ncbi:probable histone-arginine methyltransferase CARM1 [Lolium perenne]|uniref:probable histone-arginine methyltransferase CARM1 n=1 Tax=Lolium perenne TaxID=4522 RepID=UPI0021F64BBB|nr:probable histone-arginine methyltransferase CARM1 [Lolium perenne]
MASADMFPNVSFSDVNAAAASEEAGGAGSGKAVFGLDAASGAARLSLVRTGADQAMEIGISLSDAQIFKLGRTEWLCVSGQTEAKPGVEEKLFSRAIKVVLRSEAESKAFSLAFQRWKQQMTSGKPGEPLENGSIMVSKSKFDTKIEASSAQMYFHYYGQLLHQQNMLQDFVRTGTYYAAVMENRSDFEGRVVVDVGAGSGILSLFAAQAGAKHVYAVEASEMVEHAQRLISGNPSLGQRITIIKGKVEDVELPEKADILISEPMGTLLVNERMLESYVIARDRFLAPDGKMFPTTGRIHMAPFSDEYLYVEMANKALFWQQHNFFGVDLTPLHSSAFDGYFSQPVVDAFDPRLLISPPTYHTLDFTKMKEEDLYEIDIPLSFVSSVGTRVHGLACWFDVLFNGSTVQRWLTTAPGSPTTHWYQLRCVLAQPLYVMAGQEITGRLHLVAHSAQSYTIYLTLSAKMWGVGAEQGGILQTSTAKLELKEPYYRMSQPQQYMPQDQQQPLSSLQAQGSEQQMQDGLSPGITVEQERDSAAFTR